MVWIWGAGIAVAVIVGFALAAIPLARWWQRREAQRAIVLFHQRRAILEAKFFDMAQSLGKPRGLRWVDCEWFDIVTFGRDRRSGLLTAFVGINVRFEAVEGGDMVDVAIVAVRIVLERVEHEPAGGQVVELVADAQLFLRRGVFGALGAAAQSPRRVEQGGDCLARGTDSDGLVRRRGLRIRLHGIGQHKLRQCRCRPR